MSAPAPTPSPSPAVAASPSNVKSPKRPRTATKSDNSSSAPSSSSSTNSNLSYFKRVFREDFASPISVSREVGSGSFSVVYKGEINEDNIPEQHKKVALKRLRSLNEAAHIQREIDILRTLKGQSHCVRLLDLYHSPARTVMVTPYFKHRTFREYYQKLNIKQIQEYMRALFQSLEYVHSCLVIHRDIKPSNFMCSFDPAKPEEPLKFCLCDFGLASMQVANNELMETKKKYQNRVSSHSRPDDATGAQFPAVNRDGTKGFRAPEILQKSDYQTTAVDVWSAGVIFLSLLSHVYPIFGGVSDLDTLHQYIQLIGPPDRDALNFLQRNLRFENRNAKRPKPGMNVEAYDEFTRSLSDFDYLNPTGQREQRLIAWCVSAAKIVFPPDAYSLLLRCLEWHPTQRITAREALIQPFLCIDYDNDVDKLKEWKIFIEKQTEIEKLRRKEEEIRLKKARAAEVPKREHGSARATAAAAAARLVDARGGPPRRAADDAEKEKGKDNEREREKPPAEGDGK